MKKIIKISKIISIILYIILIFILNLYNSEITLYCKIPDFLIPSIFTISILYICYKYIIFIIKENQLEEEMISIINHTFRTPLTSIMWYTKELEEEMPESEKLLYVQNINNSTSKVLGIIDILAGLKDIKSTADYDFRAISLREIVEKSINKYRENINKKNITFQVSTFKDMPFLTVDLNKISFTIDTIIENAILYVKTGGKILIDSISDNKKITLFISDNGIGLDYKDKFMIFNKFYRSKEAKLMNTDGLGLRLYLAKQIIKRHHGKIYAKSNGRNMGTTFFIELYFNKK